MSKLGHRNVKTKVFNDEFHQRLVFSGTVKFLACVS